VRVVYCAIPLTGYRLFSLLDECFPPHVPYLSFVTRRQAGSLTSCQVKKLHERKPRVGPRPFTGLNRGIADDAHSVGLALPCEPIGPETARKGLRTLPATDVLNHINSDQNESYQ